MLRKFHHNCMTLVPNCFCYLEAPWLKFLVIFTKLFKVTFIYIHTLSIQRYDTDNIPICHITESFSAQFCGYFRRLGRNSFESSTNYQSLIYINKQVGHSYIVWNYLRINVVTVSVMSYFRFNVRWSITVGEAKLLPLRGTCSKIPSYVIFFSFATTKSSM